MKILTLSIKQKWFDEILAGTKKVETREITPVNSHKYGVYEIYEDDKKVSEIEKVADLNAYLAKNSNADFEFVAKKYDALKLLTGAYNLPKRPYLIVEVTGEDVFMEEDENGKQIEYEHDGKMYIMTTIDYHLGKILEVELYK